MENANLPPTNNCPVLPAALRARIDQARREQRVDSLDLDSENRERKCLRLFQFSLRDQASNWLERLPVGSITTWEDLTTRFLAQSFPPGRTAKLCNDILLFQQHHGESLLRSMDTFCQGLNYKKSLIHGNDPLAQVQFFFMTMSIPSQDEPLTNLPLVNFMTETPKNPGHY
ncbi:zinc finger, CCHC-type containing protein [Tanacetum coccineum]|uniref:Zinc finger, CCHC-type containing protein n=1 Tax=Tanacetum coccineum TaxID=301880 RepID=A0ABQ5CLK6_9ASTR